MLVTLLGMVVFMQPEINVFEDVSIIALQLLRESYIVFPLSTFTDVKLEQPPNLLNVDNQEIAF